MIRSTVSLCAAAMLASLAAASPAAAQNAPILQPGPPGEDARPLTAEEATALAANAYSPDDVRFMQDMIPHHQQAVDMAALVADRTNREEIVDLAGRIDATQDDEIAFMRDWLAERGETAPDPSHGHAHHATHLSHEEMGMATPEEMARLAASEGVDFDRLFLELMIPHHEGAVTMAEDLLLKPGSAYDPVLFEFVNDVINDQTSEIERMDALLRGLSGDPRASLAAGYRDAGEAISNLRLVASLPKPAGFFDPANPAGIPPIVPDDDEGDAAAETAAHGDHAGHADHAAHADHGGDARVPASDPADEARRAEEESEEEETEWGARSPLLSFANSDMAFAGDVLVVGNYHGFKIYRLGEDGVPALVSAVVCPGGQGDVSIAGDLLIMSVEQTRARVDCGLQGVPEDVSAERFRGLRIFDISDLTAPKQVGQVQTCRGSHTHSIVAGPGEDGVLIVYNSGTSVIRDEEELAGCIGPVPGDDRTALFRIDVIEIPVEDPGAARIIARPTVFADPASGRLAGLWQGGDHGEDTQDTRITDHCHDITVFPALNIAAGACSGNGVLFDITDPRAPKRIDAVTDPGFAYWHSATLSNDGDKVVFTDEWGGGVRARCRPSDPTTWGANAVYDVVDGALAFASYYKLPAPQADEENCVAHNGSIVPVPGRDIFAQAWYQGGLSLMDFTDAANPVEIAYFDRGPLTDETLVLAGYWSTYWHAGRIYGTAIVRGLDVFALEPSEHLSENEIRAAELAILPDVFNPQTQEQASWPAEPVVARAYVDQLERTGAAAAGRVEALRTAIDRAEALLQAGETERAAGARLRSAIRTLGDSKRETALAAVLEALADRVS